MPAHKDLIALLDAQLSGQPLAVWPGAPWAPLVQAGNLREALPLIEEDMARSEGSHPYGATTTPEKGETDSENLKVKKLLEKLWWVRVQVATDGMPLSALSTPLSESIAEATKSLERSEWPEGFAQLLCSTLATYANKLKDKKQTRLACAFFDHALEFSDILDAELKRSLLQTTLLIYQEEQKRAEEKRESAPYQARLKDRVTQLEKEIKAQLAAPKSAKAATPKSPGRTESFQALSAKSIRELEFPEENSRSLASPPVQSEPLNTSFSSSSSQMKGFLLGAACVGFLVLAWKFGFQKPTEEIASLPENAPTAAGTTNLSAPSPSAPAPTPGNSAPPATISSTTNPGAEPKATSPSVDANLDTLGARLKNVTFKGLDKQKTLEELSKDPEVDQSALNTKAADNLPKPKPAEAVEELATLDGETSPKPKQPAPNIPPEKVPLLDPNHIGTKPPTEIEPPSNPRSVEPAYRRERDSIQPGLPNFGRANAERGQVSTGQERDIGGPPDPSGKTLDGSPLQSYPVDRLPEPVIYRTITETNVLSAPSLLAQTLTRLPADTSVQVISRVGQWLELRSLGGQRGFIFAQNATPAPERANPADANDPLD